MAASPRRRTLIGRPGPPHAGEPAGIVSPAPEISTGEALASRTGDDRVEAVSMHPGVISTALLHSMFGPGGDRPEAAARAIVEVAGRSGDAGAYYDRTRRTEPHPAAHDARVQRRLRSLTMQKLGAVQHLVDEGAATP